MKPLSQQIIANKARKRAKIAARKPDTPPINSKLVALMLLPNEQIQAMIVGATQSTYVPRIKGDHRAMANLERIRKQQKRLASWTGARTDGATA